MSFSFKTILVPVDFSINTDVAISKAIEIGDKDATTLHLLHVAAQESDEAALEQLNELKINIGKNATNVNVFTWLQQSSSVQQGIADKAKNLNADLIVIGKSSTHSWFPFLKTVASSDLVELSGTAVFTVKPGALHNAIKTVVVPVAEDLPEQKMQAILALCKKGKIKVHLVTFMNDENIASEFSAAALLKFYQWLKDSVHCTVEYAVLHGSNKVKAVLLYAEKIEADILLVHPTSETKIGWMNRHISDVLSPDSKVQVLAVQPSHSLT